jgi:hypothetical protein
LGVVLGVGSRVFALGGATGSRHTASNDNSKEYKETRNTGNYFSFAYSALKVGIAEVACKFRRFTRSHKKAKSVIAPLSASAANSFR